MEMFSACTATAWLQMVGADGVITFKGGMMFMQVYYFKEYKELPQHEAAEHWAAWHVQGL